MLRKEKSWSSWRDKKIDDLDFTNEPTSGFVLNKKAGGYSSGWNHRQTYVRVYDPRGFEFEVTVPNLLYILENTNSIKGKGLEGELVYGWDGSDLVLIPTDSPDYIELTKFNNILKNKEYIKAKGLKLGATYRTKDSNEWIYMGRYDYYKYGENKGKYYFFYQEGRYSYFEQLKSLGDKLVEVISEDCVSNYSDIFDKLELSTSYSPVDNSKDEYIPYSFEKFKKKLMKQYGREFYAQQYDLSYERMTVERVWVSGEGKYSEDEFRVQLKTEVRSRYSSNTHHEWQDVFRGSVQEIFNHFQPCFINKYLTNGKLYQRGDE